MRNHTPGSEGGPRETDRWQHRHRTRGLPDHGSADPPDPHSRCDCSSDHRLDCLPAPLSWMIGVPGRQDMIVSRVVASVLPDLPSACETRWYRLAAGRGLTMSSSWCHVTTSPCYAEPPRSPAWTGRIAWCSPRSSRGCRGCPGHRWSPRARSRAGIGVRSPRSGRIRLTSEVHPSPRPGASSRALRHR
jgi:hypothetical protein